MLVIKSSLSLTFDHLVFENSINFLNIQRRIDKTLGHYLEIEDSVYD